ncbi:hypothetical protein TorRG33x02_235660, partial [Trema orientale]
GAVVPYAWHRSATILPRIGLWAQFEHCGAIFFSTAVVTISPKNFLASFFYIFPKQKPWNSPKINLFDINNK